MKRSLLLLSFLCLIAIVLIVFREKEAAGAKEKIDYQNLPISQGEARVDGMLSVREWPKELSLKNGPARLRLRYSCAKQRLYLYFRWADGMRPMLRRPPLLKIYGLPGGRLGSFKSSDPNFSWLDGGFKTYLQGKSWNTADGFEASLLLGQGSWYLLRLQNKYLSGKKELVHKTNPNTQLTLSCNKS